MAFFGPPPPFVGATTTDAGTSGLVPAPASGRIKRVLNADSTFGNPVFYPTYKTANTNYISNLVFGRQTTLTASGNPTGNLRIFSLIYIPSDGDIDRLVYRVSAAPTTAYNIHIGLWEIGSDGLPSTLVVGGNQSTGTTANTDILITVANTAVKSGFYYISHTPDATGTLGSVLFYSGGVATSLYRSFFGSTTLAAEGLILNYTTATSYNQSTHETFVLSISGIPVCAIRYV